MNICIPKNKIQEFKKALKNKTMSVESLLNMTTEERIKTFEQYSKESAKDMNLLFEQKLVLKNRLLGLRNFFSKVGEIGRYDPQKKIEIKKALKEYRDRQKERIFNPQENETFLASLAEKTIGTAITEQEAKQVWSLYEEVEKKLEKYDQKTGKWASARDHNEYGLAKYAYEVLVSQLKDANMPVRDVISAKVSEWRQQMKSDKLFASGNIATELIGSLSDIMVSSVASWDASFIGRQGMKVLLTNPKIWKQGANQSFSAFADVAKGRDPNMLLMSSIFANPNYINGEYQKAGILAKSEEETPTNALGKLPAVGKVYKASDVAFRNTALMMRTQLYDFYSQMARENGVDMTDKQIKDIGKMINSLTARGDLGKYGSGAVRLLLWAPKMIKSNWDTLTAHTFGLGLQTKFARVEAAKNTLRIIGKLAIIYGIAKALWPDSVEENPLSSDFGKIKIGDTRFDITFGMGSLVTLALRLLAQSTKSSTTGLVTKFGTGYGQRTGFDVIIDFLTNKTAPAPRFMIDLLKGETFEGDKPTSAGSIAKRFMPISLQNAIELKDNASADRVLGVLADFVGIGATSYAPSNVNWNKSTSKEMKQFKERAGQKMFDKANDEFNQKMSDKIKELQKNPRYQKLTDEEKQKVLNKHRDKIKKQVLRRYRFNYSP